MADAATMNEVAQLLLTKTRMSRKRKREIIDTLGIADNIRVISSPVEENTIECLVHAFADLEPKTQYSVCDKKYRVDLYLMKANIVVECDENGHTSYCTVAELKRTRDITKELQNCQWERYDPYRHGFHIGKTIFSIREKIKAAGADPQAADAKHQEMLALTQRLAVLRGDNGKPRDRKVAGGTRRDQFRFCLAGCVP